MMKEREKKIQEQ